MKKSKNISRKNKPVRSYFLASLEILLTILLGILVFNLGILSFIGYLFAFFVALKKKLFLKRKKMAGKLFIGTILIYIAGLILGFVLEAGFSGDLISAILLSLFACYLWFKGRNARKTGRF